MLTRTGRTVGALALAVAAVVATAPAASAEAVQVPSCANGTFVVWFNNHNDRVCYQGGGGTSVGFYGVTEIDTGNSFGEDEVGGRLYPFDKNQVQHFSGAALTWFTLNPPGGNGHS